jgi:hypothetical protein
MPVTVILPARVILGAGILLGIASAQAPTSSLPASPPTSQVTAGGTVVAEFTRSVDARKVKRDDKIEARLTMDVLSRGEVLVPRGTRIVGHIIDARSRTRDTPDSRIELSFDQIVLKNGREIPLKASIQALGAPIQTLATSYNESTDMNAASQTRSGEAVGKNEMVNIKRETPGTLGPTNSGIASEETMDSSTARVNMARSLGPRNRGVFGMKYIELSGTTQGSAISSTRQNVHLDSGTQLVLHIADPQAFADSLRQTR